MQITPAPYRADIADGPDATESHWLMADDDVRIRVGIWRAANASGTVLLFPGRTEFIEKYARNARDLVARGMNVVTVDWRGQGMAQRLLPDAMTGHVGIFADYQRDVAAVTAALPALDVSGPYVLLAHSMGGCIGLRSLIDGLNVKAVVFTGPMWGIRMAPQLRPAAWALSWGSNLVGLSHVYAPSTSSASYVAEADFADNTLTRDREMWDYMKRQVLEYPDFQLGGPSLRWLNAALVEMRRLSHLPSPDLPCVTFVGDNERIVDVSRIRDRMARWPGSQLRIVEEAEHEVLMDRRAVREDIADTVQGLMDGSALPLADEDRACA
ncbi:alpha/beta fold hydrolase [Mesobacterium pallidum]|uniref:alpha/beta fold hydrolase n=1 Tax=Mesobacterium pallidum TaxID=2872037 RepID=UPI001EE31C36|nr:alpha/beta hydrolase [Mesobacterium pallidum]